MRGSIVIDQPSSFWLSPIWWFAFLMARFSPKTMLTGKKLTSGLPQTAPVSENSNAVVIQYQNKPYVRLNGGDWSALPAIRTKGRRVSPLRPGPANCHYGGLTPA
ncbi:hypothetical protein DMI62_00740 [Escherichia coli]|nr:hypothetical protein [Escherichia coli]